MDFSKEIANFQKTGTYTYQIDDGGNLLINSQSAAFNQHYISIPLRNDNYTLSKINSFYPIEFTEFIPTITTASSIVTSSVVDLQTQLSQEIAKNESLQAQLSAIADLQQSHSSAADALATKQTIIKLRISLGQGTSNSDFSSTFPYLPLK